MNALFSGFVCIFVGLQGVTECLLMMGLISGRLCECLIFWICIFVGLQGVTECLLRTGLISGGLCECLIFWKCLDLCGSARCYRMLADDGLDLWGSFYFLNVFVSLWV